jgi:hypothetical protein
VTLVLPHRPILAAADVRRGSPFTEKLRRASVIICHGGMGILGDVMLKPADRRYAPVWCSLASAYG